MILGEGQILSQVRATLAQATEAGTLGGRLSALLRHAIETGRRARTETEIARGAASISNAAVQLAREDVFGDLRDRSALVLGAGETAELTLKLLTDAGVRSVMVANRTYERAEALAEAMNARVARFDRLAESMTKTDIVISSTGAPHTILHKDLVSGVMRKRRHRPLLLIDIAVPRDIDPDVGELDDVFLYNIDDLRQVVDETLGKRESEAEKAEVIIEEELKRFLVAWRGLSIGPLLNALQETFEEIRLGELEKSRRRLTDLSEEQRLAVELLTRGILKRVLRDPIARLKDLGDSPEGELYLDVLRSLFALPEDLGSMVLPTPASSEAVDAASGGDQSRTPTSPDPESDSEVWK
jgi:glutamyl-tRNA reductase